MFTPTETIIVNLLYDGKPHFREDIIKTVDPFMEVDTLNMHMSNIRKKLATISQDVMSRKVGKKYTYRIVRYIVPDND